VSNVQKIFYDLPTVADVLSGAFYHCFYCSFRCVFFRPTLKPILGAKLSENRRDPSRHRGGTGEAQFARRSRIVALLDPLRFLPASAKHIPGHHRPK